MQVLISNGINYDKDYWRLFVDNQWWCGKITHTLYQGAKFKEFYSYTAPVTRMCKTLFCYYVFQILAIDEKGKTLLF